MNKERNTERKIKEGEKNFLEKIRDYKKARE